MEFKCCSAVRTLRVVVFLMLGCLPIASRAAGLSGVTYDFGYLTAYVDVAGFSERPTFEATLDGVDLSIDDSRPLPREAGITLVILTDLGAFETPEELAGVRRSFETLIRRLPFQSRVALITAGEDLRIVLPLSPPTADLDQVLQALAFDNGIKSFDGALLSAQQVAAAGDLTGAPSRRVVLFLSRSSPSTLLSGDMSEAMGKIGAMGIPIYMLGIERPGQPGRPVKSLEQLARASGGNGASSTIAQLDANLERLLSSVMRVQQLLLDCLRCPKDGLKHQLSIRIQSPTTSITDGREIVIPRNLN